MSQWPALKEWDSVVQALALGRQQVIVRRGGIAEPGGAFRPGPERFLLLPTLFHQAAAWLRPEHAELLVPRDATATTSVIRYVAELQAVTELDDATDLDALATRTVYRRELLEKRRDDAWGVGAFVLEVRLVALAQPVELALTAEHAGCKSWVTVELDDARLAPLERCRRIRRERPGARAEDGTNLGDL